MKRGRTPRDVVAQVLEYASWVRHQTPEAIAETFLDYQRRFLSVETPQGINAALEQKFNSIPDELNSSHRLVIVAAEIDSSTERIVTYLREQFAVDINVVFFRTFQDDDRLYLARTWLTEPDSLATEISSSSAATSEWNGEYYVTFREDDSRKWNDASKYGFVSAGGGETYVGPLRNLQPGDRVWVHVSGKGYVGVGEVLAPAVRPGKFMVEINGARKPLAELELEAPNAFDEGQGEHFVAVRWIKSFDIQQGVWSEAFLATRTS